MRPRPVLPAVSSEALGEDARVAPAAPRPRVPGPGAGSQDPSKWQSRGTAAEIRGPCALELRLGGGRSSGRGHVPSETPGPALRQARVPTAHRREEREPGGDSQHRQPRLLAGGATCGRVTPTRPSFRAAPPDRETTRDLRAWPPLVTRKRARGRRPVTAPPSCAPPAPAAALATGAPDRDMQVSRTVGPLEGCGQQNTLNSRIGT